MKTPIRTFILALLVQSCALLDGYKDNAHSQYSRWLSLNEKRLVDDGNTIEVIWDMPSEEGKLIVMKGKSGYGKYNFVEVGDWKEWFEYSSGDFAAKREASIETRYDAHGNILKRTAVGKRKRDKEFHTLEIWTSKIELIGNDSVLLQNIKVYNKDKRQTREINLGVLNYKENLSDRLKKKIKVGPQQEFDDMGKLKSEMTYKYQDKVKAN